MLKLSPVSNSIFYSLMILFLCSCQANDNNGKANEVVSKAKNNIVIKEVSNLKLDNFTFEAPIEYKYLIADNKENIQFTLNYPNTHTIIFQNKFSALDGINDPSLTKNEMILKLHNLKYMPLVKDFAPSDVSNISVNQIEDIHFSMQTFKTDFDKKDIFFDLRVISIKDDFYAIYSFGKNVYKDINFKSTNDIIESLAQTND